MKKVNKDLSSATVQHRQPGLEFKMNSKPDFANLSQGKKSMDKASSEILVASQHSVNISSQILHPKEGENING